MTKGKNLVQGNEGLERLMKTMAKRFGDGAIMTLAGGKRVDVDVFSTGSMGLDAALGIRGLPYGRIVEVYGPESSGKTTLTLHAIAEVQKSGRRAAFIDAEHALDPTYAANLGVDLESLLISQPSSGEEALEIAGVLAQSGEVGLIVIDSVAALTPRAEIEGEMGDSHMGLQARLMGQGLRKLTAAAHQTGTCIIFINQIRQKIGVIFGSNETTTGGNALKFYASVRLDIRRGTLLKAGDDLVYGARTRVKVVKNKMAPPMQRVEFDMIYGSGICQAGELLDIGARIGVIERSGSWFSFGKTRLGQGRERARRTIVDDAEVRSALVQAIDGVLYGHEGSQDNQVTQEAV